MREADQSLPGQNQLEDLTMKKKASRITERKGQVTRGVGQTFKEKKNDTTDFLASQKDYKTSSYPISSSHPTTRNMMERQNPDSGSEFTLSL